MSSHRVSLALDPNNVQGSSDLALVSAHRTPQWEPGRMPPVSGELLGKFAQLFEWLWMSRVDTGPASLSGDQFFGGFLLTRLTHSWLVPLGMAILVTLAHQYSGTTLVLLMGFHLVVIPWVTTWVGTPIRR